MRSVIAALLLVLLPAVAHACATCIDTAYGDRTYNWPYLFLIVLPFAVAAVIGGVLVRVNGIGRRRPSAHREKETT